VVRPPLFFFAIGFHFNNRTILWSSDKREVQETQPSDSNGTFVVYVLQPPGCGFCAPRFYHPSWHRGRSSVLVHPSLDFCFFPEHFFSFFFFFCFFVLKPPPPVVCFEKISPPPTVPFHFPCFRILRKFSEPRPVRSLGAFLWLPPLVKPFIAPFPVAPIRRFSRTF